MYHQIKAIFQSFKFGKYMKILTPPPLISKQCCVEYPFTHRSEVYAGKPIEDVKGVEEVTLRLVDK